MNITIRQLLILFLFQIGLQGHSQSFLTIDGSQVFSNFNFTSSAGKKDNNYKSISSGGYSLGYRLCEKSGLIFRFNLGMRKAGSSLNYNNTLINWNLQYCDVRIGAGYEYNKWRVKPYITAAPYFSFLLKGSQNMDGLNYDLKANKGIKNSDFGILIIPGIKAIVSDYLSFYSEITYLYGIQNIESDKSEKLYNTGFFITVGMAAQFSKSKPKWLQGKK